MKARTILWAAIAMSIAVAGCSIAPVASPAPSSSPTPNPNQLVAASRSPSPTARPTPIATPTSTPTATATAAPSLESGAPSAQVEPPGTPHADPELEAFLPADLSGTPLTRASMQGSVFTGGSDMCLLICGDEPYRYAKELGVSIDAITIAFAISDSAGIGMIAYRARGAVAKDLIPARIAIGGYTGHAHLYDLPVTAAGRPATYLDAGMATNGEYLMTRHDVLFIVLGEAPANGDCHPGSCASAPPGPWTPPAYVVEALGGVP